MATDPTTLRTFYGEGSRRKSGRSHRRSAKNGMLGGDAYQQGIEIRSVNQSRGLLPVFSGETRYKVIVESRIDSGSRKRVVYASEDSRLTDYYLDKDTMRKASYFTTTITGVTNWYWKDTLITDTTHITLLDEQAVFIENTKWGDHYILDNNEYGYDGSTSKRFSKASGSPPKARITFPDGGIKIVPDYCINLITYGTEKDYLDNTPFVELQKFDAITYVKENGPLGMFPEVSKSTSYTSDMIYNGVIEPFNIRLKLYGKETLENNEGNGVSGDVMQSGLIQHMFPISDMTRPSGGWFEDIGGSRVSGVKQLDTADYVTETNFHLDAYLDKNSYDNIFVDEEMENQLMKMDATLDEGNLPFLYIDMAVGFTAPAKERFGSIVYRDMLR